MAMTRKQRRLTLIGLAGVVLASAVGLILFALSDQIVFFNSPTEIAARPPAPEQRIRLGGLVAADSVRRESDGLVHFVVTDGNAEVPVRFRGILPDLFREGQGVVADGRFGADGVMLADTVLAKHDENYMPKEVVEALKASGAWQHGEEGPASQ